MRIQKRWAVGLLLAIALLVPGAAPIAAVDPVISADTVVLSPEEQALWQVLSAARASSNMAPLVLDTTATAIARDRSADMAVRAHFDHTNPDGKTVVDLIGNYPISYRALGEMIAFNLGIPDSGSEAGRGFIASPVHHAIFFSDRYTIAGIGHALDANGKHYFTVVVMA